MVSYKLGYNNKSLILNFSLCLFLRGIIPNFKIVTFVLELPSIVNLGLVCCLVSIFLDIFLGAACALTLDVEEVAPLPIHGGARETPHDQ